MTTCFLSHMPTRGVIGEKSKINTHGLYGAIAKKTCPKIHLFRICFASPECIEQSRLLCNFS